MTQTAVKETGIIMSGSHPVDILKGRKTMTRRVIKMPKRSILNPISSIGTGPIYSMADAQFEVEHYKNIKPNIPCPYGQPGDRLWVKETIWLDQSGGLWGYKADGIEWPPKNCGGQMRTAMFMPRWASRILLEITEVRAERLWDISLDDCIKEGMPRYTIARGCASDTPPDPRWKFIELWDSLNGKKYPWEGNPWVWVISWRLQ